VKKNVKKKKKKRGKNIYFIIIFLFLILSKLEKSEEAVYIKLSYCISEKINTLSNVPSHQQRREK
jgi:hypothetical protein